MENVAEVENTVETAGAGKKISPLTLKKIIFNAVIALICIASILTLLLGDFLATDINLTITKENIKGFFGKEEKKSNEPGEAQDVKSASAENSEKKKSMFDGNMSSEEMTEMLLDYIPDDFKLEFSVNFSVNGQTLAKSAVGQKEEAVQELIAKQVDSVVTQVDKTIEQVIEVAKDIIVNIVNDSLEELKIKIREEIEKTLAEQNITEAELDGYLAKLGETLTMAQADALIDYVAGEPTQALLDGDVKRTYDLVMDHETTTKILRSIAKIQVLSEGGMNVKDNTEDEIREFFADPENATKVDAKVEEEEKKVSDVYNEYVPKLADENGKITSESLVVGLMNMLDEMSKKNEEKASNAAEGEEGGNQIKSLDDVKALIIAKINEMLDEETVNKIGTVMSYVGYALFFFMLCWFYVLVKVIVKTAFFKNKTVGLFAARFFGWMPHVFLVGLPMTLILFKDKIIAAMTSNGMDASGFESYLNMISINFHSLAWVSAAATVVLMIMLFFYYPMRRQEKREKKAAKLAARQAA